jgi:hypothetical protein
LHAAITLMLRCLSRHYFEAAAIFHFAGFTIFAAIFHFFATFHA